MCKAHENEYKGSPKIETSCYLQRMLQKLLKSINDITRIGRVFHLGTEQQEAFGEIEDGCRSLQLCMYLTVGEIPLLL